MPNATTRRPAVGTLVIIALAVTVWSAVAQAGPTPTATPTPTPTPTALPATPIIDQEPGPDHFGVCLRVEFFAPLGQTFVPEYRHHVGANLFLRNLLLFGGQPAAIFTVTVRTDSVSGPILASGSTPPLPLFDPQWVEVLFDEQVSLVPGDTYFLEVSTANVSGFWCRAGLNPYAAGVGFEQGNPTPHFDFGFQTLVLPIEEIEIDIMPSCDPNSVKLLSRGVIPVAILGSDTFNVTDVDATTLAFGPGGAAPMHKKSGHFKDANHDGIEDLLSHYRTGDSGIAIGDEEACITGETLDGEAFEGCDTIETFAPPGSRP